jgi:hypothetical protein
VGTPWRPRGPDDLDDDQRARIRRRVFGEFRPYRPSLADRAYDALALLAVPAPHIVRAIVAVMVVVSIVGTATVASADALPDEPLYAMKLAGEQVRLAIARTPEDRAAVELSMAEHRLSEAERLALDGREPDALVATSAYGAHLANAAAELAKIERLETASKPVIDQLKKRLADQQQRATDVAAHLVGDPFTAASAPLFLTVASFAPALPSGATVSEGIAEHAANVAEQLAAVAERLASGTTEPEDEPAEDDDAGDRATAAAPAEAPKADSERPLAAAGPPAAARVEPTRAATQPTARPAAAARPTDAPRASAAVGSTGGAVKVEPTKTPAPRATSKATPRPSAKPTPTLDPKKAHDARVAAAKAKAEAEKARLAYEKAKEAAKRTATPKPTPKR